MPAFPGQRPFTFTGGAPPRGGQPVPSPAAAPTPQGPPAGIVGGPPAINPQGRMPGVQGLMNHFGQMPMSDLPQPWQQRLGDRWGEIGGGQPMPANLGGYVDAARAFYGGPNSPIRPEHRQRLASMLGGWRNR